MMAPWLRIEWRQVAVIVAIMLPAHVLLAIFGRHVHYTVYYGNDAARLERLAEMRYDTSQTALSKLRAYLGSRGIAGPLFNRSDAKRVCVDILSVARPQGHYLTQTIAALLTRMPLSLQDRIRITVHNMNAPPEDNPEAVGLGDLVRVRNAIYNPDRHPKNYAGKYLNFVKESIDYTVVLDHVYESGCEYGLLLEDDALASKDWANDLLRTLDELAGTKPWIVMKLFSSFKWIPFYWGSPFDVALIAGLSIVSSAVIVLAVYAATKLLLLRRGRGCVMAYELLAIAKPTEEARVVAPNLWSAALLLTLTSLFVIFLGKYNILQYSPGNYNVSTGASCVANLYPRAELQKFCNYLKESFAKHEAKDTLWDLPNKDLHFRKLVAQEEARNGWRYRELIRIPNLFQHIGAKTSLDKSSSYAKMAVSRHYEDDDLPITFDPAKFE